MKRINKWILGGALAVLLVISLVAMLMLMPRAESEDDFTKGWRAFYSGNYPVAINKWTPLAEAGHAVAQYNLGQMYFQGLGVSQNYAQAAKWWRLAAEAGDFIAQNNLGVMYAKGEGVKQNDAEAVKWYRRAVEIKYVAAQGNLGQMYLTGRGVEQDYEAAAKWFRLVAETGKAIDQANNSMLRYSWDGVAKEEYGGGPKFVRASERVLPQRVFLDAKVGIAKAQYNLGMMYAKGEGVEQNYTEALKWIRYAARTEQDYAEMLQNRYADRVERDYIGMLNRQDNYDASFFLKLIDEEDVGFPQNNAAAWRARIQYAFGSMYSLGIGGFEEDDAETLRWFLLAAEAGHIIAQVRLGHIYRDGIGVPRDDAKAAKWYNLAAEKGDEFAQGLLVFMYRSDNSAVQDYAKAVKWIRRMVEAGDATFRSTLGDMYRDGKGVKRDYRLAYMWYNLAADDEYSFSKEERDKLAKRMTSEQIAEAQAMSSRCFARNYKDC